MTREFWLTKTNTIKTKSEKLCSWKGGTAQLATQRRALSRESKSFSSAARAKQFSANSDLCKWAGKLKWIWL